MADNSSREVEGQAKVSDKKDEKKKEKKEKTARGVTLGHEMIQGQEQALYGQTSDIATPVFDLSAVVKEVKKRFGAQSVSDFSGGVVQWPVFPFGLTALDAALMVGGVPRGKLTEIFGGEHVGKTSLCMRLAAMTQACGVPVLWMDYEYAFDVNYAQVFGVSFDKRLMVFTQPESLEEGFSIMHTALEKGFPGLIVVDSIPAMQPRDALARPIGDEARVALRASKFAQGLNGVLGLVAASWASVVFINQLRAKIGGKINPFTPEFEKFVTPGGYTLKFYAALRLHMQRVHTESWEKKNQRSEIRISSIKNKLARPYMECILNLFPGYGFSA